MSIDFFAVDHAFNLINNSSVNQRLKMDSNGNLPAHCNKSTYKGQFFHGLLVWPTVCSNSMSSHMSMQWMGFPTKLLGF